MPRTYRTANGKQINMDSLLAANEKEIAIGNMGVNARGDQLGPGGTIEKTKDKVMQDYYKLNTPVAIDNPPQPNQHDWEEPTPEVTPEEPKTRPMVRGSLASTVSKTKADQDLVPKEPEPPKKKVSRF
jgi:hypothetical protein